MQVEREPRVGQPTWGESGERVSNTWATCPRLWDNPGKPGLIPDILAGSHGPGEESLYGLGWARGLSACWWGNGLPRRRRVAGVRAWPATLGLRSKRSPWGEIPMKNLADNGETQ